MVVGNAGSVRLGTGGMAELNLGEFLGGLEQEGFMAEAVGKDEVAALVNKLCGGVIAGLALGNVGLEKILHAQRFAGGLGGVDEVEVVAGVFIMQEDEAGLHGDGGGILGGSGFLSGRGLAGSGSLGLAAGAESKHHNKSKQHGDELFHSLISSVKIFIFIQTAGSGKDT